MQLYQIIGAPLLAVVQAEVQATQVSAQFIKAVGFKPRSAAGGPEPAQPTPPQPEGGKPPETAATPAPAQPEGGKPPETAAAPAPVKARPENALQFEGSMGELQMAEFAVNRVDSDGKTHPHVVKVPVLSLFPIPLLQVKHAEFEFDIRILSRAPLESPEEHEQDVHTGRSPSKNFLAPDRVELKGLLAPSSGKGESTSAMSMKVKIRMEQSDVPAGLMKLLSIMDQNVSATPVALQPEERKE